MPDLPAFPDARFYSCTDPESLSCTEPDEAIEEYLDTLLDPKMTAAEVLTELRKYELTVTAYNPVEGPSEAWIKRRAESLLETFSEQWADEYGCDPDSDPLDSMPDDAQAVMLEAITRIARRSHVWTCDDVGKVTLSPDQIEAWVRANRPDWLEEG